MSGNSSSATFNPFAGDGRSTGLYNDQIEKIMEKCPNFIGVYASDEIPKLLKFIHPHTRFGWISNLDSSQQKGSHWVCIVVNGTPDQPDPYSIMYFDPFGDPMPARIQKDMRLVAEKVAPETFMKLKENRIKHQAEQDKNGNQTTTCGWHCMHIIMDILKRGKSFVDATGYSDMVIDKSGKYEKQIEEIKRTQDGLGFPYINIMKGDGIIDKAKEYYERIKQFITGRKRGSPELVKFIEKHGNEVITKITVCREQLTPMLKKVLNLITLGKLDQVTKDMNYDKLFHLFIVFQTNTGSYRTERNEIVRVYSGNVSGESMSIPVNKQITVGEFFERAIKKEGDRIFEYSPRDNNCQDYIISLLSASGLNNQSISSFVKQDLQTIFKRLPSYTSTIAKGVTDFAARVRVLLGQGRKDIRI
jgi:hypothetical protein